MTNGEALDLFVSGKPLTDEEVEGVNDAMFDVVDNRVAAPDVNWSGLVLIIVGLLVLAMTIANYLV